MSNRQYLRRKFDGAQATRPFGPGEDRGSHACKTLDGIESAELADSSPDFWLTAAGSANELATGHAERLGFEQVAQTVRYP